MSTNLPASEEERKAVLNCFPLINEIDNEAHLRDMVIQTWVRLWRQSGFGDIAEAPNVLSKQGMDDSLVRHTNAVVRMAKSAAEQIQQVYGMGIDYDLLLAGAFLHDIDKIVLYQRKGDRVELSELSQRAAHGDYGAGVAKEIGLPPEVVNMIASHNYTIRPAAPEPATIEAVLVAHCDLAAFQAFFLMNGHGLCRFG